MSRQYIDISGKRFTKLTVISEAPYANGLHRWFCKCDCGKELILKTAALTTGNTKSCGCLKSERTRERMTKHGGVNTRAYAAWQHMLRRCLTPTNKDYRHYGGRGILPCERWRTFDNFFADMGEPAIGLTLERLDNSKGYSKENCIWATRAQQANNKRTSHFVTHDGQTLTLSQWSEHLAIPLSTIKYRLKKNLPVHLVLSKSRVLAG